MNGVLNTAVFGTILPSEPKSWWPMAIAPDLHAVDHLADAAELRVGEHLDLDAAVGALLHQLRDLVGIERLRRVGDADVRVAQLDLRRGVARRADADDERRRNQSLKDLAS